MGRTHTRRAAAAALLAAFALIASGYFVVVVTARAAAQRAKKSPVDVRTVYMRDCARCHGAEGAADTGQAEIYNATNFTDAAWWRKERPSNARMRRVIARGGSGMPAFGKRLSAAEINALLPYVRAFKGK